MGTQRIRPGQVWVVDVYGREVRVLVISSHTQVPDTWICEDLQTGQHLLVSTGNFIRPENPDQSKPRL